MTTEIEQTALEAAGAVVSDLGIRFTNLENLTWDRYWNLGLFLGKLGSAYPWWVGDVLNAGEDVFGEEFAQIEDAIGLHPQTQANYKSIAKFVPLNRRRLGVTFSTHAEVAYLEPRERERWLDLVVEHGWKRQQLREARREARELGSVGDQAVSSSAGSEDRLLGELEPDPVTTCPQCGHTWKEQR